MILQTINEHIEDAKCWLVPEDLHQKAIRFPFIKFHREVPASDYPCAICGKPIGIGFFAHTFVYGSDPGDRFDTYVYTHVACIAGKFKSKRLPEDVSQQLNKQLSLF